MSRYFSYCPDPRFPWVRVQSIPRDPPTAPTPPPPSGPPPIMSGRVIVNGSAVANAIVAFSGDGQVTTDAAGTYHGTLPYGYTGAASLPGYPFTAWAVIPNTRPVVNLTANISGQDFSLTPVFTISGATSLDFEIASFEIVANGTTWFSDVTTGSYGYTVVPGFSGTTLSSFISFPDSYVYVSVNQHYPNQYLDIPFPNLFYNTPPTAEWTWGYPDPDHWTLQAQNPVDLTWSDSDSKSGDQRATQIESFGTTYRLVGRTVADVQRTPPSNTIFAP